MIERTEEDGLAARLTLSVGGEAVQLRTLNLDESEKWLTALDGFGDLSPNDLPVNELLALVTAYDVDGVLPTDLRKRMSKRELYAATNLMVKAEAPFFEEARSVVEASGLRLNLGPLMYQLVIRSQQASSTNGHSQGGASTRKRSAKPSLKSVS